MNFLKIKTSWSNIELGILKICLVSIGIILGVYFHEVLKDYLLLFGILYFTTGIVTGYLWIKRIKSQ